jgi:transposase
MEKIATIGLDLAKSVFQVHAVAEDGRVIVRRALRRSQLLYNSDNRRIKL